MPEPIVSSSTKLPAPALLLGTTAHARRTPRSHAFAYPTLYIGVSLDDLASGRAESMAGGGLFTYNGAGVLAIHDRDYLYEDDSASLRSKALRVLHEQAAIESEVIGPVYMVTMPRLLGYAFNPLTMYYCYRASASGTEGDRLRAVILEVNNTFGERHVYVCDPEHNAVRAHGQGQDEETHLGGEQVRGTTKPPVAYTHHFTVHRSFHVSPFNPRTGLYDVATIDPSSTIHGGLAVAIKLAMRAAAVSAVGNLTVRPEALPVTFTADLVLSTARPLSPASIARTLATYPLTLFLTVPRILYQAYLLAFVRNLWVYARPPPLSAAARDDQPSATGMLNTGRAKTIRALRPSPLADAARNIVAGSPLAAWPAAACLARAVPGSPRIGLVMRGADGSVQELAPATGFAGNRGARSVVEVHVRDADAWESLALAQDPVQGFVREYVVGHFDVRWHVSSESVASGARGGEDAGSDSGVDDTTASPVIPLASTTKDDDDSALTAFATMLVAAARRPSPRAFRAGKPVRLARRLARMVAAAAAGRTGPRGGPARDAPLLPAMNGTRAAFQWYAPLEAHTDLPLRAQLRLSLLVLWSAVLKVLAATYFAKMARFAWSPLEADARLQTYARADRAALAATPPMSPRLASSQLLQRPTTTTTVGPTVTAVMVPIPADNKKVIARAATENGATAKSDMDRMARDPLAVVYGLEHREEERRRWRAIMTAVEAADIP